MYDSWHEDDEEEEGDDVTMMIILEGGYEDVENQCASVRVSVCVSYSNTIIFCSFPFSCQVLILGRACRREGKEAEEEEGRREGGRREEKSRGRG